MLMLIGLTILMAIFVLDYFFKRRRNRILKNSGIKGPSYTLPIVGDIFGVMKNTTTNINVVLEKLGAQHGKVFRLWLFHRLGLVIKDPKFLEVILSSPSAITKAFSYQMLSSWLGDGLLLSRGAKWHARRKILTPAFHFKILEGFVEVFDQQGEVLVKKLKTKADGRTVVDVFPLVCSASLDIVLETAMGVKMNAQENPDLEYPKEVKRATKIIGTRVITPQYFFDILFILLAFPSYLRLRKSIKVMHDFTDKVIKELRSKQPAPISFNENADQMDVGQKKRLAFIDILMQAKINGKPLADHEIREEIDTFMFGGHDTSASAMSFCLYLLSRHSSVQDRAYEEAKTVLGSKQSEPVLMRDLQELKYLEAVIKESLRFYPTVPLVGRKITQDLKIGDQIIPANTNVCLLVQAVARDPDYFSQPNVFNPERFYGESPDNIFSFAYIPFSAGPRNCIGQKFAMLTMKSVISKILLNFELLPLGEEVVVQNTLIISSSTGINLGLKKRVN